MPVGVLRSCCYVYEADNHNELTEGNTNKEKIYSGEQNMKGTGGGEEFSGGDLAAPLGLVEVWGEAVHLRPCPPSSSEDNYQ